MQQSLQSPPSEHTMSSQALKSTLTKTVRLAQVVEQQARQGGSFVWRAGVGYQYQGSPGEQGGQGSQGEARQPEGAYVGEFTQGLGWEWAFRTGGQP